MDSVSPLSLKQTDKQSSRLSDRRRRRSFGVMDNQNKDGDSDGRESCGLKISEFLKALAERKSLPCVTRHIDPRNISTTLSILKNTGTGTSNARGAFRSRVVLPENLSQLSKCQYKRRDHLSEGLPASGPAPAPIAAVASSQEGQLQPPSSNPVILAHLVEKSKMLPSDSVSSIAERLKKHEICPHILGVQAWSKQRSCEPRCTLPKQLPQTGPTNEWFMEDLTDLQRKLFLGTSKKSGVVTHSQTATKTPHNQSTSLPPS